MNAVFVCECVFLEKQAVEGDWEEQPQKSKSKRVVKGEGGCTPQRTALHDCVQRYISKHFPHLFTKPALHWLKTHIQNTCLV